VLLKVAINGARAPEEHTALPVRPAEQAVSAAAALRAGAGAVHLHVRGPDGRESLSAADVDATLSAVRAACGTAPVGMSTGAWIVPNPATRLAAVLEWRSPPEFASVNFHESGAVELARALLSRSVAVEAGLSSGEAARVLVASGLGASCLRVLIEPPEADPAAALFTVGLIETILADAHLDVPRLLHGAGPTAWPLLAAARRRGYDGRIGLEDTLELPDGRRARDNAELVTAALDQLRGPATTPEVQLLPLDERLLQGLSGDANGFAAGEGFSLGPHAELLQGVASRTLGFMRRSGAAQPWAGYLAVDPGLRVVVGTCAYKGPPDAERIVELAYFTFPGWEGRGYGTAMARALRARALASGEVRLVRAHTLPERNASARILERLGFRNVGEVMDPEDGRIWRWDWQPPVA
jgi:uncharacterized protein (DUF849 family)/GNAT superfamily N-acetyltransferase